MSNESSTSTSTPLNLLQDCIIAGSGANKSDNDINMQRKCQQLRDGESSSSTPFHNFMDILRDRATSSTSSVFTTSSNNSKANAYSNMRQDFNISSKVWGGL